MAVNKSALFPAALETEMYNKVSGKSSVAKMAQSEPIPFVGKDIFTFSFGNKVSVVGESGQKPDGGATVTSVQIRPVKIVYQARFSNEYLFASEEYQINTLASFAEGFSKALAEGLDEMVLHGVNPKADSASTVIGNNHIDYVINNYSSNANTEVWTSGTNSPVDKLEAALAKVPDANGIIMGPSFRSAIAGIAATSGGGAKAYPEFGFGGYPENLGNCILDVNKTVEANSSKDRAIAANWNAFRWGFAKEMPIEIIEFGNPDGGAHDLKENNEICLRCEAFIGWGFLDDSQFARVVTP